MAELLVRDIDESLLRGLERRAAASGSTMQDELSRIIREALSRDRARLVEQMRAFQEEVAAYRRDNCITELVDSTQLIREDRDR